MSKNPTEPASTSLSSIAAAMHGAKTRQASEKTASKANEPETQAHQQQPASQSGRNSQKSRRRSGQRNRPQSAPKKYEPLIPTVISYPESLPVSEHRAEIKKAIEDHQVVIIAGETGSGKTTQIPKMCLELGLGEKGLIGHTQPRRLAARSVAERIAEELGQDIGQTVGFQVRFTSEVGENSAIKLMTDGIFTGRNSTRSAAEKVLHHHH